MQRSLFDGGAWTCSRSRSGRIRLGGCGVFGVSLHTVSKWNSAILAKLDHFGKVGVERGTTVATTWQGRRVQAFIPAPMPRSVDLPERVVRATERAAAALQRTDDGLTHSYEPLARL